MRFLTCIILILHGAFPAGISATPESRAAANFLLFSPSARISGMGDLGVAVADEPGGYYNPATPAIMAKHQYFSTILYTSSYKPVPSLASDINTTYGAFQIGLNSGRWPASPSAREATVSLGLAYYRNRTNLGTQFRTDEQGRSLGEFKSYGEADNYVIGIAGHWWADVAIGFTHKTIEENLASQGAGAESGATNGTSSARDYGVLVKLPVIDLLNGRMGEPDGPGTWRPRFDLSLGAGWFNRGSEMTSIDADQSDPLPAFRKLGWTGTLGLSRESRGVEWELLRICGGTETYEPLVGGETESGASDSIKGLEICFGDAVELRWGKYDDDDGNRHYDTSGVTVRSDGVLKLFQYLMKDSGETSPTLDFLADHLSISWTYFQRDGGAVLRNNSHTHLSLSF